MTAPVQLVALVLDAISPHGLARFWERALGMPRLGKQRFHFHVAPTTGTSRDAAVDGLLALGASRLGTDRCPGAMVLADVDGNEVCLVDR